MIDHQPFGEKPQESLSKNNKEDLSLSLPHLVEHTILYEIKDLFSRSTASMVCRQWDRVIKEMPSKSHCIKFTGEKIAQRELNVLKKMPFSLDTLIIEDYTNQTITEIEEHTLKAPMLNHRVKHLNIITQRPISLALIFKSNRINLLQQEVDKRINELNAKQMPVPLYYEVIEKKGESLKALIAQAVNTDALNTELNTSLSYAAFMGAEEALKLLIKKGANINYAPYLTEIPIVLAAKNGHLWAVELLLIHATPIASDEAIVAAAGNGHLGVVKLLLEKVSKAAKYNAFTNAVDHGHQMVADLLLTQLDSWGIHEAFISAGKLGYQRRIRMLLANVNSQSIDTALKYAVMHNHFSIVKLLSSKATLEGARIALKSAIQGTNQEIIAFLLSYIEKLHKAIAQENPSKKVRLDWSNFSIQVKGAPKTQQDSVQRAGTRS